MIPSTKDTSAAGFVVWAICVLAFGILLYFGWNIGAKLWTAF